MKTLDMKKKERTEKKKKKLLALANLIQLNDSDRFEIPPATRKLSSSSNRSEVNTEADTTEAMEEEGFTLVTKRKNASKNNDTYNTMVANENNKLKHDDELEPDAKRIRKSSENIDGGDAVEDQASLSDDMDLKDLRRIARDRDRARNKAIENMPVLRLREFGERARVQNPAELRTPIFLADIQHLLMTALIGKKSPCTPERWCYLERPCNVSHSLVVIVEGLSLYHYLSNESNFEQTNRIFDIRLEVMLPPNREGGTLHEIAQVPLTQIQSELLIAKHGSLMTAIEISKDPTLFVKSIFPIEAGGHDKDAEKAVLPSSDKFDRTKLLLSALQMVEEGYPMPLIGELDQKFRDYVYTKDKYAPVTSQSPMYGLDCEMCRTTAGCSELTRITIVNEKYDTVYETLVRPVNKIVDYLTRYSGITAEILNTVTKTLPDVQKEVRDILPPDAILVGQSLNCDLNAMKMMHPYVIDTSVCFNLSGKRRFKSKLQTLAKMFLKENIQENDDGHDSMEDSIASLKLVQMKLANCIEFGDEILLNKRRLEAQVQTADKSVSNNLIAHCSKRDKRTAIITSGSLQEPVKEIIQKAEEAVPRTSLKSVSLYELDSNKLAVRKARELALENSLTIANLQYAEEHLMPANSDLTFTKLDKWIGKMWNAMAHNGMFVLIMAGSPECKTGVAKVAVKCSLPNMSAT